MRNRLQPFFNTMGSMAKIHCLSDFLVCARLSAFLFLSLTSLAGNAEKIFYVTDLEGNLQKWNEFIDTSGAFERSHHGPLILEGIQVVNGGDVMDGYPGELQILRDMGWLGLNQPQQFTFILGNRDLNKAPLAHLQADVPELADLLRTKFSNINAGRLFENHRLQLKQAGLPCEDGDVAASLIHLVRPNGLLRRQLENGKLAKVIGMTLFVHGRWSPLESLLTRFQRPTVGAQVDEMNAWKDKQLMQLFSSEGNGGIALMNYQSDIRGPVYGSYSDANWNPKLPDQAEIEHLKSQGIHRIVVGHRMYGQTPAVIRTEGFEILFADNSGCPECGVSIIEIEGSRTRIRGRTTTGDVVDESWDLMDKNNPIGHYTQEGKLIVGRNQNGLWLLFKNPSNRIELVPPQSLRYENGIYRVDREKHTIDQASFEGALSIENPKARVNALKEWNGEDLSELQINRLIQLAKKTTNSFEMGECIRLAGESRNIAWLPILDQWVKSWASLTNGWQVLLRANANEAMVAIRASNCKDKLLR